MKQRAYSVLTVKSFDDANRTFEGIATTPTPDRMGDIVEPQGAQFTLPIPLLWQHDNCCPVGSVIEAKVSAAGIWIKGQIAQIDEDGELKERLTMAWQSLKIKLVRGLSIGFMPIESARIEGTWSDRYLKWDWMELSCVTIPANAEATIKAVKSADQAQRAAMGRIALPVVRLATPTPGVTGAPAARRPGAVYLK